MTTTPLESEGSKKRIRSPAYPYVSLPKAIEFSRTLFDQINRHYAPFAVAIDHLGFATAVGGQVVSALTQFGLMESTGEKKERKVKLTDHALKILGIADQKSEAFMKLIKRSALLPKLYADLMKTYSSELPSDAVLCYELIHQRFFNPGVVPEVVRAFRETISFAHLDASDTLPTSEVDRSDTAPDTAEEEVVLPPKEKPMQAQQVQQVHEHELPPPSAGAVRRTFTAGNEAMDAAITITSHAGEITGDDIAFLKEYLSFLEKGWARRKPPVAAAAPVPTISTPPPPPPSMSASVQLMITKQMDSDLRAAGFSEEQINAMTPEEAQDNLRKAQP
jgi:hypothetical protein